MAFASLRRAALGVCTLALAGACTVTTGAPPPAPLPMDAAAPPAPALGFEVTDGACADGHGLCLAPRQSVDLTVTVTGADADVSLGLEGTYTDASLSRSDVHTSGGRATFTLHAPSTTAAFALRARADGAADARIDVSVSATGFASVRVAASYGGHRPVTDVVASAFVGSTCAELAMAPLADGAPASQPVAIDQPLTLDDVPAGGHVAVQARLQYYASGCRDLDALAPNAVSDAAITILDRPLDLAHVDLETRFAFDADATALSAWSTLLQNAGAQALEAFVPSAATSEAGPLLDAMHALVPAASQTAFDAARTQDGWDAKAASWLSARPPTMRARTQSWMDASRPMTLGPLDVHLDGMNAQAGLVALEAFGPLAAADAGLSANTSSFVASADAQDVVHLSGSMAFSPSVLLTSSTDAYVVAKLGVADCPTALAGGIDCAGLASSLVGAGESYPGCAAACTATLCEDAIGAMWTRAKNAALHAQALTITASASASVGPHAEPSTLLGSWVGDLGRPTNGGDAIALKGTLRAPR